MAGSLTIQRVPRGLLDLLVMKGSGRAPVEMSELVTGTVDLSAFYLQDTVLNDTSGTNNVNAVGYFSAPGSAVPDGELRLITNVTAIGQNVNAAGETMAIQLAYQRPAATTPHLLPGSHTGAPTQRTLLGYQFAQPLIARSGTTFGVYCWAATAANTPFFVKTEFYRLLL